MFALKIQKCLFTRKPKKRLKFVNTSHKLSIHTHNIEKQLDTSTMKNQLSGKVNDNEDTTDPKDSAYKVSTEKEWVYDQKGDRYLLAKSNNNFETYYSAQSTCASEAEWQSCLAAMRKELPQSFRVDLQRPSTSNQIINLLKKLSTGLKQSMPNDANASILRKISWCKKDSIWQLLDVDRWKLSLDANLKDIHSFLYHENELGHISRQELVSQVPVLLLGIKPHHRILDMCASPGSKTKQVVSLLHDPELNVDDQLIPPGLIIANESNPARCDTLSCNLKKQSSPCLITVNQDAQIFPDIHITDSATNEKKCLKYDRIVCDVPCSGDGTIRKNPTVWCDWTPGSGNSRHHLQYNIVERGVELLEIGGLIAYSSCAINPVENEAVIGRLLLAAKGSLELVDVDSELPGLNWAPGHTSWRVYDGKMNYYKDYDEVPEKLKKIVLRESMFSNVYPNELNLNRTMRLLPHHNDCGGFYVAIIKKISALPWQNGEINKDNINDYDLSPRVRSIINGTSEKYETKKFQHKKKSEVKSRSKPIFSMQHTPEFFTFLKSNDTDIQKVFRFYNLPRDEHFVDTSLFFSPRGKKATIYSTNEIVKNILENNVIDADKNNLNVFYAGAKVIEKETKTKSMINLKGNLFIIIDLLIYNDIISFSLPEVVR